PEGIKAQQRNWIGRSEGVQFTMRVVFGAPTVAGASRPREDAALGRDAPATGRYDLAGEERGFERDLHFDVFTTRIDTIFGMTFCVLSPEHAIVEQIAARVSPEHAQGIRDYQQQAKLLSDTDRTAANREKTGVFTGAYAVNPANGQKVPIYLADYVLATYGTGAIMAVPGHDDRDFEFAERFGIPVLRVIGPVDG